MKPLFFSFVLYLVTASALAQTLNPFVTHSSSAKITIPLSYRSGGSPTLKVMVNGQGPFTFLFDTGSPDLLKLDEQAYLKLKLSAVDSVRAGDGSGRNTRTFPITRIEELEFGGYKISHSLAMVRNYNGRPGVDPIDGVIGPAFFKGYLVELDFEHNQLLVTKDKLIAGTKNVYPMLLRNGVPGMVIRIGEKSLDADLDTGNMGGLTLSSNHIAASDMAGEPRVIGRAQTVSNSFEVKEVQLKPSLFFGDIRFDSAQVVLNDVLPHINVGIRLLKQMNICFDMENQLVRLVKVEGTPTNTISNEYAGIYGDRVISVGNDGSLYVQRPGGMLLKLVEKQRDRFGIDKAPPTAELVFERDASGKITGINVNRGDGKWEKASKSR